jgi:hypothetical protein
MRGMVCCETLCDCADCHWLPDRILAIAYNDRRQQFRLKQSSIRGAAAIPWTIATADCDDAVFADPFLQFSQRVRQLSATLAGVE